MSFLHALCVFVSFINIYSIKDVRLCVYGSINNCKKLFKILLIFFTVYGFLKIFEMVAEYTWESSLNFWGIKPHSELQASVSDTGLQLGKQVRH